MLLTRCGLLVTSSYHSQQMISTSSEEKVYTHIASQYDVKFIFMPVDAERNFLLRIINALARYLNQVTRLPRILMLMLDCDFTTITGSYEVTKNAIKCIIANFVILLHKRKKTLPHFACKMNEPKIVVMKPMPKSVNRDLDCEARNKRRVFNRSVEDVLERYDNMYAFNIDQIKPEELFNFEDARFGLANQGLKKYWRELDGIIACIDYTRVLPLKDAKVKEEKEHQMLINSRRGSNDHHRRYSWTRR